MNEVIFDQQVFYLSFDNKNETESRRESKGSTKAYYR